jgi:pimeloyl-ACP methyl ester carboxylesterase
MGALGAQLAPATAGEAKAAGMEKAVKISGVLPGLTAEALKLQAGDILVRLAGTRVSATNEIAPLIRRLASGKPISIEVFRAGKQVKLEGPLRERPRQKEDGFKVVYDQVMTQGKRVRIIITHPEGDGPFPTLFLIGGIGAYSVDGDFPSVAYGNVMQVIAKSGYATVRVDKPGQGDSEGPVYSELLFDQEMDAYRQALKLVKTLPFIDPKRIAIFGQSMGGTFGPLVAAEEEVAGVAVHGTLAKTWVEYVAENTRRQSLLAGATPAAVDDEMREVTAVTHYMFNEGLTPAEIKAKHPKLANAVNGFSPDGKTYSGVGIPFFQQLATKNLPAAWAKTQANVLVLYGENDFLSGQADHEFIVKTVNDLRPGTAEFKLLKNADHGFSETSSPKDSMDRWGRGGKFNPNIVDALKEWLDRVLKA